MDDIGKSVGPVAWRVCKRDLIAQSCPEGESQYHSRSSGAGPGYFEADTNSKGPSLTLRTAPPCVHQAYRDTETAGCHVTS